MNRSYTTSEWKRRGSNDARTEQRARRELEFIGVDGEGVNVEHSDGTKTHRYVMLSVGDETLWIDGRELTHHDIFPFLYEQHLAHPKAVFVGFFLSYDFSMILKSLTRHEAEMLWTRDGIARRQRRNSGGNTVPFPVYVGDEWEIDILGMKRFKLRPATPGRKNPHTWMTVCDTGAYFQTSFMRAIDPAQWPTGNTPCTLEEYELIGQGKAKRGDTVREGDTTYLPEMVRYNRLENAVLARMMAILNQGFVSSDVRLAKDEFYGPGQAIQKWLDRQVSSGAHLSHTDVAATLPDFVVDAAIAAFYGGRFELFYHGHLPGKAYEYDISSAYPHAMRLLPCLCEADWEETHDGDISGYEDDRIVLFVYGTFRSKSDVVACLPWRARDGRIRYPSVTRGWYVWDEVKTAIDLGMVDADIERRITYRPKCAHRPPLAEIADLYAYRKTLDKTSAHGKAIKLMINSGYGKLAQSIGNPKYGNPVYAAMITATCRSMILHAIGTHPGGLNQVVMAATDGVYFRSEHTGLTLDSRLGGWERAEKHNLTLMKPGVYWDDKARQQLATGDDVTLKSRGISARTLAANIGAIDDAFTRLARPGTKWEWPTLAVTVPFTLTTPQLALARGKWDTAGTVEWDGVRTESADPASKRCRPFREGGTIRTRVWQHTDTDAATEPYAKRFGFDPIVGDLIAGWGCTPDGDASEVLTDVAHVI